MALLAKSEPVPFREDSEGVIRVGGTRVTLDTILTAYMKGSTPEQIAQDYSSLATADIYAAIAYYLRHREEVEESSYAGESIPTRSARSSRSGFPAEGLRDRLESRLRWASSVL
jgi:uncharacterized protein (DUF433 family)